MELIKYDFNNLPEKIKKLPNWVLWKKEQRENGKFTKIPYQIDGNEARANDYRTWSFFNTAMYYFGESNADGVGFVFSKEQKYIGVDIDGCVSYDNSDIERKKPILSPLAKELIEKLNSYAEISVSGTGVHIIIEGELAPGLCDTGRKNSKIGLEIYRYARYFTMSGNVIHNEDVNERTDEINEIMNQFFDDSDQKSKIIKLQDYDRDNIDLSNAELWERMFSSKSGKEIQSMFRGELNASGDRSSTDLALCNHLAFWTDKSYTRMDSMFRETGLMRGKWDIIHYHSTSETYGQHTISMAIASTSNTILDGNNKKMAKALKIRVKGAPSLPQIEEGEEYQYNLTEKGNSEFIEDLHSGNFKPLKGAGWMIWDGKRWNEDNGSKMIKIVSDAMSTLHDYEDEKIQKWALRCESIANVNNTIKFLRSMDNLEREDFDRDKYLFNLQNGTMNLKTGELKPHDRNQLITNISNIEYDKYALCPTWIKFINQITTGRDDIAEYLQRLVGYSMTGSIEEQIMIFLVGDGSNGKSTFINIIKEIMGTYGKQTNSSTFIAKQQSSGINNDVARLKGSRFVSAIESEQNEKLSESVVKQVTGGEPIMARFLNQEYFEFTPEFKVFFTTNHKPIIKGIDNGIWRRIKLIPFDLRMSDKDKDRKLPEMLQNEMQGILNWCLEGAKKYIEDGLKEPSIISQSVDEYKSDMDILEPFILENCEVNEKYKVIARDLYQNYLNFCFKEGETPLKNRAFYRMLTTKGFEKKRGNGNKFYIEGIAPKENVSQFSSNQQKLINNATRFTFSNSNS